MNKMYMLLPGMLFTLLISGCSTLNSTMESVASTAIDQDIQIYTTSNSAGKIDNESLEKAFEDAGLIVDSNNDMNRPFQTRFGNTTYKTYRLATVHSPDLVAKLAKDHPSIGLLTPLSMSIWSDDTKNTLNISTLTLRGMSRITQIPIDEEALIAYSALMTKALKSALPDGHFQKVDYQQVVDMNQSLATTFTTELYVDEDMTLEDAKDDLQSELESELETAGFVFPGFISLNYELQEHGVNSFDLYDTYSVCKLNVIYPITKTHPEVGAFAPCTFYMYKKKDEAEVHMGFPSIKNWMVSTDIVNKTSLQPLLEAQELFIKKVEEVIE